MSKKKIIIWVLNDGRAGNYSQGLGLGEGILDKLSKNKVESQLQIKKINYNFLVKFPNFLKINGLMGVDRKTCLMLRDKNNAPNIIISAGRRCSPIVAFLKKYHNAFVVQIMNPNFNFKKFDLVILPKHDKYFDGGKNNNVIRIDGALGRIHQQLLLAECQKFTSQFNKIFSPKIAFLVGGSSKKAKFSSRIAKNLGKIVSKITNNMQAHLLVLNSRRTGEEITEILDNNLQCSKTFFKWQGSNWENPYFAVLQSADFIIVTGDSISMCSEVCSLGKPVYIFSLQQICSKKHLKFHQNLFEQGFARKLEENIFELDNYSTKKLDETNKVVDIVLKSF